MENSNYKILLVDDEEDILEFLGYNLRKEGYQVFVCNNGKNAIEKALEIQPQLIILDIMMPDMDGVETCISMKTYPILYNSIIVFLTARNEDYSQIAGFEAGADDYITKPIKPKILVSRVKALLNRIKIVPENSLSEEKFTVGDLIINREKFVVIKGKEEILLPKKEFELLYLLASKPNKVFAREEIFEKIWDADVIVGERTIDVHIRKIREKIGINNIKTVKGVGYKFEI